MPLNPRPFARDSAAYEFEKLYEVITGPETKLTASSCCECGKVLELCSGPRTPTPGDFTLCFSCGCLNVFSDGLGLRRPTDEEIFAAAANGDLQILRRGLERFAAHRKGKDGES